MEQSPRWTPCGRCGAANIVGAKFCANCGLALGPSSLTGAHNAPTQQSGVPFIAPTQAAGVPVSGYIPPNTQYSPPHNPYQSASENPYVSSGEVAPPPPISTTIPPNPYTPYEQPPETPSKPQARFSRRTLLIGGAVAAAATGTGLYFIFRNGGTTIPISLVYSTEKTDWLNAALSAFNQSSSRKLNNKNIEVTLTGFGSVDSQTRILNGQLKPTAWCPASSLEMSRLDFKWKQDHHGNGIISTSQQLEPQSLVKSPLVLMVWQERAQRLLAHYHVHTFDWPVLHQALQANSWSELGGDQKWGRVKFGQTVPELSNSGLLTVTLLAYKYFNEPRTLTTDMFSSSSKYWGYLDVFEQAVNKFGCSSQTYLQDVIAAGPAQADVIATYENLALTYQPTSGQPLLIYYPDSNILSDHPFAVLQGDWVTDEQSQAALQFRDFLLAQDQQTLLIRYGFRPGAANSTVSLNSNVPGVVNPFTKRANLLPDHHPDPLQSLAKDPSGDVVDALITGWDQKYKGNYTTLDCSL